MNFWNIIIVTIFILIIMKTIKPLGIFLPVASLYIFNSVLLVLSSAYIEEGITIADLGVTSYFTGSTLRLVILLTIFLFTLVYFCSKYRNYFINFECVAISEKTMSCIIFISFIYVGYILIDLAISGTVISNSAITRFNYYSDYSTLPYVSTLASFKNAFALVLGIVFSSAETKKYKILSIGLFAVELGCFYLVGNQFTAFLYLGIYFVIPVAINILKNGETIINVKNIVLVIIALGIALLPKLSYFQEHSITGVDTSIYNTAFSLLLYRAFGLQAGAWWEIDRQLWQGGNIDFGQIATEIQSLFDKSVVSESGIYYIMEKTMSSSNYSRFMDGSATLCAGHPALEISIFGYVGAAFIMILEAGFLFVIFKILVSSILEGEILDAFVAACLLTEVMKMFNVGGIFWLTNTLPVLCMIFLFVRRVLHMKFSLGRIII